MKFRFVDKITALSEGQYICGIKAVSLEESFLARPLGMKSDLPPSLMAEALFQLGNFLIYSTFKTRIGVLAMFGRIEIPGTLKMGEIMSMRVEIIGIIDDSVRLSGCGYVDDRLVIRSENCIARLTEIDRLYNPAKFELLFRRLLSSPEK